MDKAREWVMIHVMIPIYAIRLLKDDLDNEVKTAK
jgi:hypothetical protein